MAKSERKIVEVVAMDLETGDPVIVVERRRDSGGKNGVLFRIPGDYGNHATKGIMLSDVEAAEVIDAIRSVLP
jgi:hypothetical protein